MRNCHADNGICEVAKCKEEIENEKQTLTFCGMGSHRQNGKSENHIKLICNTARSMLTHAMNRYPEVVTQSLWPHATSLAVDVRNRCKLDKSGLYSLDKFIVFKHSLNLRNSHAFGCPSYVLAGESQDYNIMNRWHECIRFGACLGCLKNHASNVSLTLNFQTRHISLQFYVVSMINLRE